MVENKVKKVAATVLAATMLNGCIAPQTYSWKTESIVSTAYNDVGDETANEMRFKIIPSLSEGTLSFSVKKQEYGIDYDILQPIQTEQQRQYGYGRGKTAAMWTDIGLGTVALGILLESVTTSRTGCFDSNGTVYCKNEQGSVPAHLVLTTGLLTTAISGGIFWSKNGKKERPTKNYQTIEVELDARERRQTGEYVLQTVPAINTNLEITSSSFTINGQDHTFLTQTNVLGNATVQLIPSSPSFAFTLDQLADSDAAQQLAQAGFDEEKYLPILEQAAIPVTYNVIVKTNATEGKNADVTIQVKGYELPQKALEQLIMGL